MEFFRSLLLLVLIFGFSDAWSNGRHDEFSGQVYGQVYGYDHPTPAPGVGRRHLSPQGLAGRRDLSPQSPGQIRRLLQEDFLNPNPTYNYAYQVADEGAQTYITHDEGTDDNVVTGERSYVDASGALITVTYISDKDGYRETPTSNAN